MCKFIENMRSLRTLQGPVLRKGIARRETGPLERREQWQCWKRSLVKHRVAVDVQMAVVARTRVVHAEPHAAAVR